MGILHAAPLGQRDAVDRGLRLVDSGASIIDVSGLSGYPDARDIDPAADADLVHAVVSGLASSVTVAVTTGDATVAAAGIAAGASILNDHSGDLASVAKGCTYVVVHGRHGVRSTDVVSEVTGYLRDQAGAALAAGAQRVWIDPGFGFGKTTEQDLVLMGNLRSFTNLGHPLLVGISNKDVLGDLVAQSDQTAKRAPRADRLEASLAAAVWATTHGAAVIRAHDVRATVHALVLAGAA
jgi:dihydropteroate synthase